jgi:hypothetical protein
VLRFRAFPGRLRRSRQLLREAWSLKPRAFRARRTHLTVFPALMPNIHIRQWGGHGSFCIETAFAVGLRPICWHPAPAPLLSAAKRLFVKDRKCGLAR